MNARRRGIPTPAPTPATSPTEAAQDGAGDALLVGHVIVLAADVVEEEADAVGEEEGLGVFDICAAARENVVPLQRSWVQV